MRYTIAIAVAALPLASTLSTSTTGRCGKTTDLTCLGSVFGSCCSQYNYCGSTSAYCGTGCQSNYGSCGTVAKVSTDGSCGGSKGFTCLNSAFGNCCSQYGYCGKTAGYCGRGCDSKFGTCAGLSVSSSEKVVATSSSKLATPSSSKAATPSSSKAATSSSLSATRSSSTAVPSSSLTVSNNSRCGKGFTAFTCSGSKYGDCCSQYSYCGSTEAYCGVGCQAGFGICRGAPSSSSSYSSTGVRTSTSSLSSASASQRLSSASKADSISSVIAPSSTSAAPTTISSPSLSATSSVTSLITSSSAAVSSSSSSSVYTGSTSDSSSSSRIIIAFSSSTAAASPSSSIDTPSSFSSFSSMAPSPTFVTLSSILSSSTVVLSSTESSSLSSVTTMSTVTPTSSTSIGISSSSSSTPAICSPTNIITTSFNPSFDTGNTSPWQVSTASTPQYQVASAANAIFPPFSGPYAMYFQAIPLAGNSNSAAYVYLQTVPIPAALTVKCTVNVKFVQNNKNSPNPGVLQVGLIVSGNYLSQTVTGSEVDWTEIGGVTTVANNPTLDIFVAIIVPSGYPSRSWTVGIDNLVCVDPTQIPSQC